MFHQAVASCSVWDSDKGKSKDVLKEVTSANTNYILLEEIPVTQPHFQVLKMASRARGMSEH